MTADDGLPATQAVGLLYLKGTWLGHFQLGVHQYVLCRAAKPTCYSVLPKGYI